jgi:peptidoglycan/LPS O-acetylase OafA/YrhL
MDNIQYPANKVWFPHFDKLRAFAALIVVFGHVKDWVDVENQFLMKLFNVLTFYGKGAHLGVVFFFILSGFLITYLLFQENTNNNHINIRNFYIRRILRIWPVYFFTVFIGFYLYPVINQENYTLSNFSSSLLNFIMFIPNYDYYLNGSPVNGILGVHWSLGVEEQFYLVWPLFVKRVKNRHFLLIMSSILVFSEFYYMSSSNYALKTFGFISNLRFLSIGSILAYIGYNYRMEIIIFNKKIEKIRMFIYLFFILLLIFQNYIFLLFNSWLTEQLVRIFIEYFFIIFLIINQNFNVRKVKDSFGFRLFTNLGKISFGIYMYHMLAILIVLSLGKYHLNDFMEIFLIFFLTFLFSYCSYYYMESRILKLKTKFQ